MITNATLDTFVEYDERRNDEQDTYFIVPATIGPEDGRHLFSYLGVFLTYITPRDLTVGTIHSIRLKPFSIRLLQIPISTLFLIQLIAF